MRTAKLLWMLSFFICLSAALGVGAKSWGNTLEVEACFSGGNTDAVVDAYVGMPGDGWTAAWREKHYYQTATPVVLSSGDAGFSEVKPGSGSYLSYTGEGLSSVYNGSSAVFRKFGLDSTSVNLGQPHTIEFTVRIDEDLSNFTDYYDRYCIYDTSVEHSGSSQDCSWLISAYGGEGEVAGSGFVGAWTFYDGDNDGSMLLDNHVDTNIALTTGGVYDFTIDVDPVARTYDATVSNGTSSFSASDLGWRCNNYAVGGYLGFNLRNNSTSDTREMSIDNVKVSQDGWFPPGGMTNVSANFNGGNSRVVVDAYPGTSGDGWARSWQRLNMYESLDELVTGEATVVSSGDAGYQELSPGDGAYLHNVSNVAPDASYRVETALSRDYKGAPGIDYTREHTISFKIRLDEDVDGTGTTFTNADDRYYLFDLSSESTGPNAAASWMIFAAGGETSYIGAGNVGEWTFYDGDQDGASPLLENNVDTNIALVQGGVYEFTIVVDPETQTYDATVDDGNSSFSAYNLGWRTDATYVGGIFHVACWSEDPTGTEGDSREFSLDSLIITQEPLTPGDANGDGYVNAADAEILAENWLKTGMAWGSGDFNYDGTVNDIDATLMASNWGTIPSAAVPEPGTLVLLVMFGLTVPILLRAETRLINGGTQKGIPDRLSIGGA